MSKFANVNDKINFSLEEEKTLAYWDEINAFQTSIELSKNKPEYTFYDGPPFATGLPHYGHILAGTIKDTVTRYAHQTGHYVSRRFGWDCHGLPVEYEIDKKLNITGRDMVLEMGVAKYNNECRGIVQRYTKEWERTVTRLGRWIDFKNDYKTMDPQFMESVWWVFKTIYSKGLVYRGYKVMPYSMVCGTPLSNFEAGLNYKDVNDPAVVVTFPLESDPGVSLIAWTTTPWTLPSNLALCVNSTYQYVKIFDKTRSRTFILLEKRLQQLFPEVGKADCTDDKRAELYDVLETFPGEKLVGLKYEPIFPYFSSQPNAFRVISDSYVTEEGGTGIVHQAPAFGEDDYRVCLAHNIVSKGEDLPCPVDANGRFTDPVSDFKGRGVKDADNDICSHLKANGRLVLKEQYFHSYPFCWRSDSPLIYKAVPSWFVSVEKIKDKLVENNQQTYWVPAAVQEKRFHNWLVDAKDWAISRNRFWGTPIPLWISDDLEEVVAIGSVQELEELSGAKITDLHKESIDHITIPSKQGKGVLKRIDEVFDCWFESGSMPYAQLHYPFENSERFEKGFPADFIAEGLDQTRGWFYTLMVISTCLFDKPAFKNLIVNGLVLAADGKKMSKRLKNYPDPVLVLDRYGSDALRLYLINSPVVKAETLKFTEEGVNEIVRGVLLPWFNAFRFFTQCVERYEAHLQTSFVPNPNVARASRNDVDVWIMAASVGLVDFVHVEMKAYRLYTVVPRLLGFVEELTNWYVRLNRERLKGLLGDEESFTGLCVLYEVLLTMTLIMAPFSPFFSEYLYQYLRKCQPNYCNTDLSVPIDILGKSASVHYLMLPQVDNTLLNPQAEARFKVLQQAVQAARTARERRHIRTTLPLKNVLVISANKEDVDALQYLKSYFLSEINAWDITTSTEWEKYCKLTMKPNFAELGKRLGGQMKAVAKAINELTVAEISNFMASGELKVLEFTFNQQDLDVKIEFSGDKKKYEACASDDGKIMVAIDTTCDDEVMQELTARLLAASVQKLRKSSGLVVADKVEIFFQEGEDSSNDDTASGSICAAIQKHAIATIKRIKVLPLPMSLKKYAPTLASDVVKDSELGKLAVKLVLTRPCLSLDELSASDLVKSLLPVEKRESVDLISQVVDTLTMYIQSMDYESTLRAPSLKVIVEGITFELIRDKHYYASAQSMVMANRGAYLSKYPYLPISLEQA